MWPWQLPKMVLNEKEREGQACPHTYGSETEVWESASTPPKIYEISEDTTHSYRSEKTIMSQLWGKCLNGTWNEKGILPKDAS